MKSPIRWPGGKARLAPLILQCIPQHDAYVETCCGGAAVFWAKPRDDSKAEILNDADGELINFYYVLHKRGRRLAREVDAMPYSRALLGKVVRSTATGSFRRAANFWYLTRVAFGGQRRRPTFGVQGARRVYVLTRSILDSLDATIERLRGVAFESIDVVRLLKLYDRPGTFFYVDPPFWGVTQAYACRFREDDHGRLAEALGALQGPWLLSYNDCPLIRRLYAGHHRRRVRTRYTMGCNSGTGGKAAAVELLISNRPLPRLTYK